MRNSLIFLFALLLPCIVNTANAQAFPDLIVDSAIFRTLPSGEQVVDITLKNIGSATASPNSIGFSVRWVNRDDVPVSDNYGVSYIYSGIAAGATYAIRGTIPPTSTDAIRLKIEVDDRHIILESNEENNILEVLPITPSTSGDDLMRADEEIVEGEIAEESGEKVGFEPGILPGNPFYFFKNGFREVHSFFTLNPEKKAELRLKFSNEKILEANKLAEQGKVKEAAEHLKSYEKDLEKIEKLSEKLDEKFAEKLLRNQLKQQVLIGKIERETPVGAIEGVKRVREKTLEHIGNTVARVDEENIAKIVPDALKANGSPFKLLRNLEVLKAVEEKVPEQAKEAIQQAEENSLKRFKSQIEALPEEHQKLLSGYIEKAGGDEITYLKVFDDLKFEEVIGAAQDQIVVAKEKLLSRAEEKIEKAQEKDPALAKKLLSGISAGTIANLRVIKDMEDNFGTKLAPLISEIKGEATQNFSVKLGALGTSEKKEEFVKNNISPFLDIKQIEILDEAKEKLPEDKKQIAEDLKIESLKLIKEGVVRAQKEKNEAEREAKLRAFVGDNPEQIEVIKEVKQELGNKVVDTLISTIGKKVAPTAPLAPTPTPSPTPTPVPKLEPVIPLEPIKEIIPKLEIEPTPTPTPTPIEPVPVEPTPTPTPTPQPILLYPDLIIQSPSFIPTTPIEGDIATFWAMVKNQGEALAVTSVAYLKIDGMFIGKSASITVLVVGQTATVTFPEIWTASVGKHILEICADGGSEVAESNETNNCSSLNFVVAEKITAKPDLVVLSPLYVPSVPTAGTLMNFGATVKNQGTAGSATFTSQLSIDGVIIGKYNHNPFVVNQGEIVGWNGLWKATAGKHTMEVCTDINKVIEELNETNNCASTSFTVL